MIMFNMAPTGNQAVLAWCFFQSVSQGASVSASALAKAKLLDQSPHT